MYTIRYLILKSLNDFGEVIIMRCMCIPLIEIQRQYVYYSNQLIYRLLLW